MPDVVASHAAVRVGAPSPDARLHLAISLPLPNEAALDAFLTDIYNPASPNFRHYLSVADFTARFAPTAAAYKKAADFFRGSGLAVTASAPNRILVYPDGATGNTPPLRVIEGSNTSFFVPDQLAVDRVHGEILVPSDLLNEIDVFPIGASGNVFPARSIAGPATGLSGTSAVAVDQAHDELVVLSVGDYTNGAIEFFPRNANGNVAPLRTIQGRIPA